MYMYHLTATRTQLTSALTSPPLFLRLEKLMGLSGKSRKKMESKLNKEFRDYEGIGGNFGSFLMQLDDLEAYVQGKSKVGVFAGDNEVGGGDSDVEEAGPGLLGAHILDDDEQEESDVDDDMDVSSEDEDTDDDGDGDQAPQLVGDGDEEDSYGSAVDADASDTEDEGEQVYYSSSSSASGDDSGSESDSGYEFDHADRLGDMERGEHYSESVSQSQSQSEPESTSGSESDSGNESGEGSQSGSDSDSDSDMDADERRAKHARKADEEAEWAQHAYRPASGEDIYGRCTAAAGDGGTKPGKYIPPAMRAKMAAAAAKASDCGAARGEADDGATASSSSSSSVNTNTAEARALKKQMNGTLNRLSDSSKDATLNALCALFNNNSRTVCCHLFKDALFATCASETQIMASLVPMYAAMVAGLHFAVSTDVGAFMIEALAETLHRATTASTSTKGEHELISNKAAGNLFMLLLHLYGLRVLHHQMIVDFLRMFSGAGAEGGDDDDCGALKEAHLELVHAAVEHCGPTLRADDPVALKDVITALSGRLRALVEGEGERGLAARAQFFLEALTDLKNNRSRRTQSAALETQTRLRKWLGAVKSGGRSISHASSAKVTLLRISLRDILDVGKKGRWWRAGASWAGRSAADVEQISAVKSSNTAIAAAVAAGSKEERRLLKLADKMSMNTPLRRSIFVVLMSSTDVHDALERLLRMDLKGKDDREIARVVTECCAQEKTYNAFYGTVSGLLCDHNRQHKTTFQFCVWDSLKVTTAAHTTPSSATRRTAHTSLSPLTSASLSHSYPLDPVPS